MQVGDTALALEDPRALQLDLRSGQAVEQAAPLAEEHRETWSSSSSSTPAASASRAIPAPWTSTFLSPAASVARVIAVVTSST